MSVESTNVHMRMLAFVGIKFVQCTYLWYLVEKNLCSNADAGPTFAGADIHVYNNILSLSYYRELDVLIHIHTYILEQQIIMQIKCMELC